jgi:hypothetical protein
MMVLLLLAGPYLQEGKWTKTKVNENITVRLPPDFYEMTPQDLAQRFPSVRQPIGAWTNDQRLVDISIKVSATQWQYSDTPMAKDFFKASVINLYDKVEFMKEQVEEINGKNFIVLEFDSRIEGEESLENRQAIRMYNYVMYLIQGGQTYVFSFQAPTRYKENWQQTADTFMHSVKVK